jgi:hypothetical protein
MNRLDALKAHLPSVNYPLVTLEQVERLVAVVEAALDWDAAENYGHRAELQGVFEEAIALQKTLAYWLEDV